MHLKARLSSQRGTIIPMASVMIFAVMALGAAAAHTAISTASQSHRDRGVKRAAAAADSAIGIATYRLNQLQPKSTECVNSDPTTGALTVGNPTVSADGGTNNWCGKTSSKDAGETGADDAEKYSYYVSPATAGALPNTEQRMIVATGTSRNVSRRTMAVVTRQLQTWGPYVADVAKDFFIAGGSSVEQDCKWCPSAAAVRSLTGKITMMGNARVCAKTVFSETSGDNPSFVNNANHFDTPALPSQGQDELGNLFWGSGNHWCYTAKALSGGVWSGTTSNQPNGGPYSLERWDRAVIANPPLAEAVQAPANPDGNASLGLYAGDPNGAFSHVGQAGWNTPTHDYISSTPAGVTWDPITKKLIIKGTNLILRGKNYDFCYLEVNAGGVISVQSTGSAGTTLHFRDPAECPNNPAAPGYQNSNSPGVTKDSVFFAGGGKIINQRTDTDPSKVRFEVEGNPSSTNRDDAVWFDGVFSPAPGYQAISVNAPHSLVALHDSSNINGVKAEYLDIDQNSGVTWDPRVQGSVLGSSVFTRQSWYECTAQAPTSSPTSGCVPAS